MWFQAIKLAVSAGSKIYANKQKTKIAMSDAQLMHASRMADGFLSWRVFMVLREHKYLRVVKNEPS